MSYTDSVRHCGFRPEGLSSIHLCSHLSIHLLQIMSYKPHHTSQNFSLNRNSLQLCHHNLGFSLSVYSYVLAALWAVNGLSFVAFGPPCLQRERTYREIHLYKGPKGDEKEIIPTALVVRLCREYLDQ